MSQTIKNPQSLQLFLFFEGSLAPPKTIKKRQKPLDYIVISRVEGLSKTPQKPSKTLSVYSYSRFLRGLQLLQKPSKKSKNLRLYIYFHVKKRQKPLDYKVISFFLGFIKKCRKLSKTLRVYSYSFFLRGLQLLQNPSKNVKKRQ